MGYKDIFEKDYSSKVLEISIDSTYGGSTKLALSLKESSKGEALAYCAFNLFNALKK